MLMASDPFIKLYCSTDRYSIAQRVYMFAISIKKQQEQIIFIRLHALANERATKFSAEAARRFNLRAVLKLVLAEALFIIRAAAAAATHLKLLLSSPLNEPSYGTMSKHFAHKYNFQNATGYSVNQHN
jgi:hypothetical protein